MYNKLNSAEVLIQRTTQEASQGEYALHRLSSTLAICETERGRAAVG